MPVYLLPKEPLFPPVTEAEPDGLLAIGGDFSAERLLNAYASGIFPWFEEGKDIFWFSPDPRLVLYPGKLKISDSLYRVLKQEKFEIRFDTDFAGTMKHCAGVERKDEEGTWISERFIKGYTRLFNLGFAHSVEAYFEGKLAGGLYGVSLGNVFCGESMFYLVPDASKVAFVHLVLRLREWGFRFIDCQVETSHLKRFGAELISRENYLKQLQKTLDMSSLEKFDQKWKSIRGSISEVSVILPRHS